MGFGVGSGVGAGVGTKVIGAELIGAPEIVVEVVGEELLSVTG